jgi:hypothetical protein
MVQGEQRVMELSGRRLRGCSDRKKQCSVETLVVDMNESTCRDEI